jgi:hypothetical protein
MYRFDLFIDSVFAAGITETTAWVMAGSGAILTLANGVFAAYSAYKRNNREDDDAESNRKIRERDVQVESMSSEIGRLQSDLKEAYTEIKLLRREVRAWERRVAQLEISSGESPLPSWELGADRRYISVNQAYVREMLAPIEKEAADALGRTNAEIWGEDIGNKLDYLDLKAVKAENKTSIAEGVVFHPETGGWLVIKRQRIIAGRVFGMYGTAVPMKNLVSFAKAGESGVNILTAEIE